MASAKSAGYKLATDRSSDGPRAGLVIGEEVFDAAKLTGKPAYATEGVLLDENLAGENESRLWSGFLPPMTCAITRAVMGVSKMPSRKWPTKTSDPCW